MYVGSTVANWFFVGFVLTYWLTHLPLDIYMIITRKQSRYPSADFDSLTQGFLLISTTVMFWLVLCIKPFVYFITGYDFLSIRFRTDPTAETIVRLIGMIIMFVGLVVACLGRIGRGPYMSYDKPRLATKWGHKIVRHPEYFMYIVCFVGMPLASYSWALLYLLLGINSYIKIADQEEKILLKLFGKKYEKYMQQVGKLFPKIKRERKY
ncbi:MAG: methyltransferase family protein [Candidatus Heimdallarchaeaceae archaeon]